MLVRKNVYRRELAPPNEGADSGRKGLSRPAVAGLGPVMLEAL